MEFEGREKFELLDNADLITMLQNLDMFDRGVSLEVKRKFPDLLKFLNVEDAKVDLTSEERNALLDWLEGNFGPVIDKHKAAIDFLRTEDKAESEEQIKILLDLEKSVKTQESYWTEKHRGKGFAYLLVRKLIHQK